MLQLFEEGRESLPQQRYNNQHLYVCRFPFYTSFVNWVARLNKWPIFYTSPDSFGENFFELERSFNHRDINERHQVAVS